MVSVMGPEFAHRMGILDREIFEMFSVASSRPAAHPFPFNNLSFLSSRAKPRDLQFSSSASAIEERETADPSLRSG
jgi:hypothetical protein